MEQLTFRLVYLGASTAIGAWAIWRLYSSGLKFLEQAYTGNRDLARQLNWTITAGCAFGLFDYIAEASWPLQAFASDPVLFFELEVQKIGNLGMALGVIYFLHMLILTRLGRRTTPKPADSESIPAPQSA